MILIAVIIGYLLGVLPFVCPKIIQIIKEKDEMKIKENNSNMQEEILNEWLNGNTNKEDKNINQEDIFKEYITGKVVKKGA